MFYFAWVDKSETTFNDAVHTRVDEEVFSLNMTHAEGDFPALSVQIINPRVGLLTGSRKQWVWVSYGDDEGNVTPIFFGRLLGVPQAIHDNIIALMFIARPSDYEEQRTAVADALRVLPYFDPLWIAGDSARDPDSVLEGYSRLWHIDRITHEVTTSDILDDGGPTLSFGDATDVFRDSVKVSHGQSPVRRVVVTGRVEWDQSAAGTVDITQPLLKAFRDVTTIGITTISGMERRTDGMINVICGDDLLQKWPNKGDNVGSGWSIGETHLDIVGGYPLPPTIVDSSMLDYLHSWTLSDNAFGAAVQIMFGRTPGLAVNVLDYEDHTIAAKNPVNNGKWTRVGKFNILWVPVFRMAAAMHMDYNVARARTETIEFAVDTDVQPLLSDPGDEETMYLDVGVANVDIPVDGSIPIGSVRRNRFLDTDRGRLSFEHMLCRARAILVARSRAVDITFSMPLERGLELSCRDTATLYDPRLPGGSATGKVKQYALQVDGQSGASMASVTIGCAVGRGGTPTPDSGSPVYVNAGYVDGYQVHTGSVIVPAVGDVSYDDYGGYAISDDGVDLIGLSRHTALESITVTGGLDREAEEANNTTGDNTSGVEVMDRIRGATTTLRIEMLPLAGGPFDSVLTPTVHQLRIPKMIDLEVE